MRFLALLFLVLIPHQLSQAAPKLLCQFAPPNTMQIPAPAEGGMFSKPASGITEKEFKKIIADVVAAYVPIAQRTGNTLVINNLWSDATVNSDTSLDGNQWTINAYGGLARYPGMTPDAYEMVLLHEMGHHLGGAPTYSDASWAATEGQADYFATMKGFRQMFTGQGNQVSGVPATVTQKCSTQLSGSDVQLCERSSMAALVLAKTLQQLGGEPAISFDTPDPSVVASTYEAHPAAQCRLDTYFNGSACGASYLDSFSQTDPTVAACNSGVGARPKCWYKAPSSFL